MFNSWPWKPWGQSRDRRHLTTPLPTCLHLELDQAGRAAPGVDASALPGGGSTSCRSTWGSTPGCCSNTTFRASQPGARGKHSGPMVRRSGPAVPQEGSGWTSVALASPASRPSCRITAPTTSFVGGHVIRVPCSGGSPGQAGWLLALEFECWAETHAHWK